VTAAAVDGDGRVLVSLKPPLDSVFPAAAQSEFFRPALATGRAWVAHSAIGPMPASPHILVAVPVTTPGRAAKALVAVLAGDTLTSMIWRHRLAEGASVYILDSKSDIVARVSAGDSQDGSLDDDVATARRTGWEGVSQFVTTSGRSLYAAYARSPEWGWTATLIVPASTVDGSWRRWLAMVIGGGTLLLLLGVALALLAARSIASPIAALARSAEALGRGEAARPAPSVVTELDEVGHAISDAATARQESARELEIRAGQQAAIVALGQRALAGSDIATLLDDAAHTLCSTLGAELCHVLELATDGTHVARVSREIIRQIMTPARAGWSFSGDLE
jgi:signal transduction histidine kinase